jgi:hypothetical protein
VTVEPVSLPERHESLDRRFTFRELVHVSWLRRPMTATPAARAKLLAWEARTPRPWPPAPDPATVLTSLEFVGDRTMPHVLARLISELPPPVADYAIARVAYIGVGMQCYAFCGPRVQMRDRPWLIVLGPGDQSRETLRRVMAHEIAHTWLLDEPEARDVAATAFWHTAVFDEALRDEDPAAAKLRVNQLRIDSMRDERQARELAACWGFEEPR